MRESHSLTASRIMRKHNGFTIVELVATISVLGIIVAIAIPAFSNWLPKQRLRSAARDLYTNMQLSKMGAIKSNAQWAIVFDNGGNPGRYYVCSDDGANDTWDGPAAMGGDDVAERTIEFAIYKSGITYGCGNATDDILGGLPGDPITYAVPNHVTVFNPKGTSNGGYVYLHNQENTIAYGVGTLTTGVIRLFKWNGNGWE
jgi:prepilin-type N-terminal cleavage/methylation domain-containing protein